MPMPYFVNPNQAALIVQTFDTKKRSYLQELVGEAIDSYELATQMPYAELVRHGLNVRRIAEGIVDRQETSQEPPHATSIEQLELF